MPGSAFKSRSAKQAPGKALGQAPEKAKAVSSVAEKQLFAKEMHFQVYRIENVLKITSSDTLKGLASKNPALLRRPSLMRFFDAYQGKKTNEFIDQAKGKSQVEREKLLEGIRKVIFKAQQAKKEYTKARTETEKKAKEKAKTEEDREIAKMQEMLKRDLTTEDLDQIETNLATPMSVDKNRFNLNKIQHNYISIIAGQKAMGSHIQVMQKDYGSVVKRYKKHTDQYTSYTSWKKYLGVADYGWRGVKKVGGWLKSGWNYVSGSKSKPSKSPADKINEAISESKKKFKGRMDRVKTLKQRIAARSAELKKGLVEHKSGIRGKLKSLISREDWTKAKKLKHEQIKALLKSQKDQLGQKLLSARTKESEIDRARTGALNLGVNLKNKYSSIKTGEKSLGKRVISIKARLAQLEKMYGKTDPRVVHIRTKVLVPLLKGQDRVAQVKEGTATKLNVIEEKNQKLDILKADMYVGETSLVEQISKTELQIGSESKKIGVLSKNRAELHKLLEGMETAYMAVSEFKESVTTNLDKMVNGNKKAGKAMDKQYGVLGKLKATEPGMLRSIYNTVGIGQFGILGVGEMAFQHPTRVVGWLGKNAYNLFSGDGYFEYSETKKWHIGTPVNWVYQQYDKYIYQGAKKLNNNTDNWFLKGLTTNLVFGAGAAKAALGFVNGVVTLVVDTETVVNSLDLILNDWGEAKRMLKGVVHWDEWSESVAGAAGQTAGDLVIMFFTAGAGKGASAAKVAVGAGTSSKLAYAAAFSKEIIRQSLNGAIKIVKLPFAVLAALKSGVGGVLKRVWAITKGVKNGEGLSQLKELSRTTLQETMGKVGTEMAKMADDLLKTKSIASEPLKDLLKKIGDKGVNSLTKAELGILKKGLAKELPKVVGWKASNMVEKLGSTTGKYSRLATKMEKITGKVVGTVDDVIPKSNLGDVAKQVLEGTPKGAIGTFALKSKLGKYLESLFRRKQALAESLKSVKRTIDSSKEKLTRIKGKRYKEFIQKRLDGALAKQKAMRTEIHSVHKELATLKPKFAELKVFAGVATSFKNLRTGVLNTYDKVADSLKNLKPAELVQAVGSKIIEVAKWPVWLPTMYARVLYKMSPARARAILSKRGLAFGKGIDEVTGIVALGEVSKRINGALLRGNLKEALKLYYGSRSLAKQAGVPFAAMDKSFLGYIHRVAPITVKKIHDAKQLTDISFINALPAKVKVNTSVMKSYEKRAEASITKFIKSKPKSIPKIPPKKK